MDLLPSFDSINCFLWIVIICVIIGALYSRASVGICHSKRDLSGLTVIITGANAGIGKETALDLAKRNARVILACRNMDKANQAANHIISKSGNPNVVVKHLNLASLSSVQDFVKEILATESRLDILINNAGIGNDYAHQLSEDNYELVFQTNHLGHFFLTTRLLELLKKSKGSRIVNVSSLAHMFHKFNIEDLNCKNVHASISVYANSKLANIFFTKELSERLVDTGVTVNALHPGMVRTDILRNASGLYGTITKFMFLLFGKNAWEGAQTTIHLAVDEKLEAVTGKYFSDCKESTFIAKITSDIYLRKKLWEESEKMITAALDKNLKNK